MARGEVCVLKSFSGFEVRAHVKETCAVKVWAFEDDVSRKICLCRESPTPSAYASAS